MAIFFKQSGETVNKIINNRFIIAIFYLIIFLVIFNNTFFVPVDPDLGWHLRYGKEITETRVLPVKDEYSFTTFGKPYFNSEWMTDVIHFFFYEKFGLIGLSVFSALITSLGFFFPLIIFRGKLWFKLILCTITSFVCFMVFSPGARSQNISFLFLSVVFSIIFYFDITSKKRFLMILPVVFFIWTFFHPVYMIGLIFFGIYCLSQSVILLTKILRKMNYKGMLPKIAFTWSVFLLSGLVLLIIPKHGSYYNFGLDIIKGLLYPAYLAVNYSQYGMVRNSISEWLPVSLVSINAMLFILCIIFSFIIFTLKRVKLSDFPYIILLVSITYFSTLARRNVSLFFCFFIPFILIYAKDRIKKDYHIVNLLTLISFLILSVYLPVKIFQRYESIKKYSLSNRKYCDLRNYPCKAIEHIKDKKYFGNIFNFYDWGGYLIWHLPEYKVFVDGRFVSSDVFKEYMKVSELQKGWIDILKKYEIKLILMPKNNLLYEVLNQADNWDKKYEDERSMVLVKK